MIGLPFELQGGVIFTNLVTFNCTNGAKPLGPLFMVNDGKLYGVTEEGGIGTETYCRGGGTVFELTTSGGFKTLATLGINDGSFYGTTTEGGAHGVGTFFFITPSGEFENIYSLTANQGSVAALTQEADGRFYAVSYAGGPFRAGIISRFSVSMPPVFQSVEKNGAALNLTWNSVVEQAYQLQYISGLDSTNWTNLGTSSTATNGTTTVGDAIGAEGKRFFASCCCHKGAKQ